MGEDFDIAQSNERGEGGQMKNPLTPLALIRKKRDGQELSQKEIEYLISEYNKGGVPDYQISAFLMAVFFRGMNFAETISLMQAMKRSGKELELFDIKAPVIDKHSTGGVGDKVSLVLAPLVASCGICVPMISGRGLGHTGGTLDKLESIPGFRTDLSAREFKRQLRKIGVAMVGQTSEIAPADRKMYALRDVTATVDSIPLIAASIMSKKLAEDLDGLILDVKFGSGAFMQEYKKAKLLARTMVQIGRRSTVKTVAILTCMDSPLGINIGNSLEVIEAIEALKGNGPDDLMEVTFALGTEMLKMAKIRGGTRLLKQRIANGQALEKFRQLIENQGGDPWIIEDYFRLPVAKRSVKIIAQKTGYVHNLDTYAVGMSLVALGGGRLRKEDGIDPGCGFKIYKKHGEYVNEGESLAEVFSDHVRRAHAACADLQGQYIIRHEKPRRGPLVREKID
jgi:pyrimidine-nucleoside phosphorylase